MYKLYMMTGGQVLAFHAPLMDSCSLPLKISTCLFLHFKSFFVCPHLVRKNRDSSSSYNESNSDGRHESGHLEAHSAKFMKLLSLHYFMFVTSTVFPNVQFYWKLQVELEHSFMSYEWNVCVSRVPAWASFCSRWVHSADTHTRTHMHVIVSQSSYRLF